MEQKNENLKKERIWELDFIRGLCVLLMIFDHTIYDLTSYSYQWFEETGKQIFYEIYSISYHYFFELDLRLIVEPIVVIIFCAVCGISCSFSRNNLKRAIELAVCSILITIVTTIIESPITFGILHMLTVSILMWCLINFICRKKPLVTAFACGIIGIAVIVIAYVCNSIYETNPTAFTDNNTWYFLGEFMRADPSKIVNNDDQPIFPLMGYMLLGAAIGPIVYKNKKSLMPSLGKYDWYAPVNFWGRIAIWVYIFHQIIIAGVFAVISLVLTGKLLMP